MAPNGQASAHAPQPVQAVASMARAPVQGDVEIASTGQASAHDGSEQCLHTTGTSTPEVSIFATRILEMLVPNLPSCATEQAISHDRQPEHLSKST
jgi:hypothetical protein